MDIVLIKRKGVKETTNPPKPLWLACVVDTMLPLSDFWTLYAQRFNVDHWNRLAQQRLHWTLPQLGSPDTEQSWSDLIPLMTWQLWLAREIVQDEPLPWQKSLPQQSLLTPGRVAQAFSTILATIGTPACSPKPRGKSPGWPKGTKRTPKIPYPTVKKRYSP